MAHVRYKQLGKAWKQLINHELRNLPWLEAKEITDYLIKFIVMGEGDHYAEEENTNT